MKDNESTSTHWFERSAQTLYGLHQIPMEYGKELSCLRVQMLPIVFSRGGKFWAEDPGSTNGAWRIDKKELRGRRRIEVEEIRDNEELQIGNTILRFLCK